MPCVDVLMRELSSGMSAYSTIAETFDRARGGELAMRSLIGSNAHHQTYGLIYSKVAEPVLILRSH
jgi:hypothetical protein